ncbi:DUF5602 domain-containing protein [Salegentibacter sp. JZCK2]|uniref:DUF5602 domain-containing protein n=1 Tax=Salegentibacter tibetensis TaxID=2873600 RepID=UPI001CC929DF|nr:DUF5602 domain-containing protein [Salegentibacter tibetensis]MBZ9729929.1 DUF5602 domain-containing protein [Salegentibacter tibetensis]
MKKINFGIACVAMMLLILTSCSSDEAVSTGDLNQEKATVSFGAMLSDLVNNKSKQAVTEIPACSDEDVVYVEIVLSNGSGNVVGSTEDPFRIDLVEGELFTKNVPELELDPGNYSLDYFVVYDGNNNAIWVTPMAGSPLADFVNTSLPIVIDLRAGVKKYVEVPVLCFDDRMVNEYGYLFFDLIPNEVIEWCVFGNYCDENGRHHPAAFSMDIWRYENDEIGTQLYSDLSNSVELDESGDYAASPLCVALPDTEGVDEYYVEITLLNSDAYGEVTESVIRQGVITDEDVRSLFSGESNVEYFHFQEGCSGEDSQDFFSGDDSLATYYGPSQEFADGTAWSMVQFDSDGDLHAIALKFSESALSGMPEMMYEITLPLPEEAEGIVFDHIDIGFMPQGHEPPGVYDIPHFDLHFYMISHEEKMQITDAELAEILPPAEYIPATYIPTPGFIPMMGKHWLSMEAGELNGEVFDQTFIMGSYNGSFIFFEPMVTLDYLNEKTSMEYQIHQPQSFERTGYYYPTRYSINYDAEAKEYTVMLSGMVWR